MDPQGVDLWSPGRASGLRRPGRSPFLPDPRPLGTVLLAAGRRGAAAAGPPCGGSLRPGPRSVPRLPRARPLRGSAPGRTRWGAARHSPPGGPWAVPRGRCSGGPASGAWGLSPVPRRACLLPGPSSPGASARSPRPFPLPSPSPSGGGGAQEVDARCGGDGRRPPTPARKKASPPVAPATCEKAQNTYFVQLYICPQNPPSLKGFLKKATAGRRRAARHTPGSTRSSAPDIKPAASGKASPKSMEMGWCV